jgi:hypothetical protein
MNGQVHTITVLCKYYLALYITNVAGDPADLSMWPAALNELKSRLVHEDPNNNRSFIYDPSIVTLLIPSGWETNYGKYLSGKDSYHIMLTIEHEFKQRLRKYLVERVAQGSSVSQATRNFLWDYGIPDSCFTLAAASKDFDTYIKPLCSIKDLQSGNVDASYIINFEIPRIKLVWSGSWQKIKH